MISIDTTFKNDDETIYQSANNEVSMIIQKKRKVKKSS